MTQLPNPTFFLSWVCKESCQVNLDVMRSDIMTAFMTPDFDWGS